MIMGNHKIGLHIYQKSKNCILKDDFYYIRVKIK